MKNTLEITLAWATKVRHIAIDRQILCRSSAGSGYSLGNGCYNSIGVCGIPTYHKISADTKYTHYDGIIDFLPLEGQGVNIRSVCKRCRQLYKKELAALKKGK